MESSIIDGRFRQQKKRLIDSICDPKKILYIIEGNKNVKKSQIVNGAIINMLYKHDFKLLFSKSPEQTLTFLSIIYKKLQNGDISLNANLEIQNEEENGGQNGEQNGGQNEIKTQDLVTSPIRLISKGDSIKNKLFQCLLTVIPGISITIANRIVEIYPTLKSLMDKYRELDDIIS